MGGVYVTYVADIDEGLIDWLIDWLIKIPQEQEQEQEKAYITKFK